jgi:predicted nucleic-acid-binding Zn-ribbon protein
MNKTGVCPKCGATDIRVERQRMWGTLIPVRANVFGAVYASHFICASCGFVEMWVERPEDLEKIRRKLPSR